MLQNYQLREALVANESHDTQKDYTLSEIFHSFTGILQRQYLIFIIITSCALMIGALYLFITPPSYIATAAMVIDTRDTHVLQDPSIRNDAALDAAAVQTEVEILKSPRVGLAVLKALDLMKDPELTGKGQGFVARVLRLLPWVDDTSGPEVRLSNAELTNRALMAFEGRRTVARVGLTHVMEIGFRSNDAAKAAKIVDAIANAYLSEQLDAKYETTRRGSAWLRERLDQLRQEASAAERAVVEFKGANNIVMSGKGLLMNEQELSELNSQLILARAATAEAKARLGRIEEVIDQGVPDASVTDALKSEVIVRLRNQYLDYAARERIFSERYGPNHLATTNLRTQIQEVRLNIEDQMRKIAESYKSDYQIAAAREQSLATSLGNLVSASQGTNTAQIKLHELESAAQSYRTIYDNFLQRYMRAVQQQSYPITESRLVGPAIVPTIKSQPNSLVVFLTMGGGGLILSLAIALCRELSDRGFRTPAQVEDALKTSCIATLPSLTSANLAASAEVPADSRKEPRTIVPDGLLRYVVDAPFSQFAEGLRLLQVVTDLSAPLKSNRIIGVTSTLPKEGKSTLASNFAHLIAHAGEQAILIDCDLRNPTLTHQLAPEATLGFVHVVTGKVALADAIWTEATTGLKFLPAGASPNLFHTSKIIGSLAAKQFFDQLRETFDYVIVDLPPLAAVVDTRATSKFIDSYIYVVEWARTNRHVARNALLKAPEIYERLLAVALNKADFSVMSRYTNDSSPYLYGDPTPYKYVQKAASSGQGLLQPSIVSPASLDHGRL